MPKITARSGLNVGTELTINEAARTFTLNVAGNLVAKDGVTLQAVYSKFVELWNTASYQDSPFPMYAIDAKSGQFQFGTDGSRFNGWRPANDSTRQMLRDGGWSEFSAGVYDGSGALVSGGELERQYVGIVGLGAVSTGSQLYFQRTTSAAPTNFTFTDQVNEGIQVFGNSSNGNFDTRTYFKAFVREYAKKYEDSVLADTGQSATGAYTVNMLLSNEDDLKIQAIDGAMSAAPYDNITVSYYTANQSRSVGGNSYNFKIIIDGNNATLEQIYTKIQYLLRQNSNINTAGTAGTVTGKTAETLLTFVGDTLETATSVFIDNIQNADSNRVKFKDDTGTFRENPYQAVGSISFNSFLVGAGSSYRLFFTTLPGANNDYGEAGAVTVNDASGTPITGTITSASISFTFDYDGNVQGGRTAGTDAPVTLIGVRPGFGKYAVATGSLTRSKGISLSLVAEQDRAYT